MSGLPNQIMPQSMPLAQVDGKQVFMEFDWYLFFYNLAKQVIGTGGGGSVPISPFDSLDAANLFAQTSDVPQAYRQIANLRALIANIPLPDPTPAAQPAQAVTVGASPFTCTALANGVLSVTSGTVSAVTIIRQGVSVATGIGSASATTISSFTDEKGMGGAVGFVAGVDFTAGTSTTLTLSKSYGSATALWVAFDGAEQGGDTYTLSTTTLTFNAVIPTGTSKVYVKGANASTVTTSGGLVPVRRLDQVQITYTAAPTVVFLPY